VQDNASVHTSKETWEYFENYGIAVLKLPPYSPDLNPIEHMWAYLKKKVLEMFLRLLDMTGEAEGDKAYLFECL